MELNISLIKVILKLLKFEILIEEKKFNEINEKKDLINTKNTATTLNLKYNQVFNNKHGFLNNLNIIDLFNLGPKSLDYLKNLKLIHQKSLIIQELRIGL